MLPNISAFVVIGRAGLSLPTGLLIERRLATARHTRNGWLLALGKHVKHIRGDCSAASLTNKALLKDRRPITSRLLQDYLISQEAGSTNATGEEEKGGGGVVGGGRVCSGGAVQPSAWNTLVRKLPCVKLLPGDGESESKAALNASPTQ